MSSVIFVITYNNVVGVARLMRAWLASRARTLMIDRAVQLPPRGDGRPRSLSAFAVAFVLSPAKSDRISPSCCARVGLPAYGLDALPPHLRSERNRTVRVAELDAARLGGRESRLGAFRDLGALLLGDRRVDVQHERVGVRDRGFPLAVC